MFFFVEGITEDYPSNEYYEMNYSFEIDDTLSQKMSSARFYNHFINSSFGKAVLKPLSRSIADIRCRVSFYFLFLLSSLKFGLGF